MWSLFLLTTSRLIRSVLRSRVAFCFSAALAAVELKARTTATASREINVFMCCSVSGTLGINLSPSADPEAAGPGLLLLWRPSFASSFPQSFLNLLAGLSCALVNQADQPVIVALEAGQVIVRQPSPEAPGP